MPFIPTHRRATQTEEESYVPQSGFGEYLVAQAVGGFVETGVATASMESEALAEEIKAYPEASLELQGARLTDDNRLEVVPGMSFIADRSEKRGARLDIATLPKLSKEDWKKSQYYREGMRYEPDITEARLKVYSEWYDARARREDIIERRNAGFIEGTVGFLAGMAGSMPDPINFVSFGVAPGARLATKIAVGAMENVAAEWLTQLTTMDARAEAGIAPTEGERLLNGVFAALTGGAFSAGSHFFSRRAARRAEATGVGTSSAIRTERTPKVVKDSEGRVKGVEIENVPPRIGVLNEKVLHNLTVPQKRAVLQRVDAGMEGLNAGARVGELDPHNPDFNMDTLDMAPFERVVSDALAGDPKTVKAILEVLDLDNTEVRTALMPNKSAPAAPEPDTLAQNARRVDAEPELEKAGVGDNQNIDLTEITVPEDDPLLQGKTLFEVADKTSDDFETGLSRAVDLINEDGCK